MVLQVLITTCQTHLFVIALLNVYSSPSSYGTILTLSCTSHMLFKTTDLTTSIYSNYIVHAFRYYQKERRAVVYVTSYKKSHCYQLPFF